MAATAAGAALISTPSAAAETLAGAVASVRGMAFAEIGPGTRTLIEAAAVYLDDLLRTGEDSRLGVKLTNGNQVSLGARAKLKIDRATLDGGGALTVDSGSLILDRPDPTKKGRLTVTSPYAVIAVRGTKFFVGDADGYGVFVERGEVQVSAAGKSVTLRAGQGTTISAIGAPPDAPKEWGAARIAKAIALTS
ncbi:FecR family protein [Terrarubrum flagellatum]|uniref:FecR family protein n=1 Tax=Terrirubrum flagellatum TaxID=2895980 RepID=UPI0031451737